MLMPEMASIQSTRASIQQMVGFNVAGTAAGGNVSCPTIIRLIPNAERAQAATQSAQAENEATEATQAVEAGRAPEATNVSIFVANART